MGPHHALQSVTLDVGEARERGVGGVEGLLQRGVRNRRARVGVELDEMIEPVLRVTVEGAAVVEEDGGKAIAAVGIRSFRRRLRRRLSPARPRTFN
jgi:hypothetical protein